jgi:signal peptidase I
MTEPTPDRCSTRSSEVKGALRRVLRELTLSVLPAILLALFIRTMVAEAAFVDGPSMQPNLYTGFAILVEKVSYHLHQPQRGDVVLFDLPGEEQPLVKRVVALPGELVAVRGGHTYIDGQALAEPWVSYFGGPDYPATRVPAGVSLGRCCCARSGGT